MGEALYRKYRSKRLADIVGQEHITTALQNALENDRIGHAYLFTGPRGVGKTSIARILAHEVNQLLYDETVNHLDIIEIDAASNRRIDEIRTLRERVHNAPTSAKYKVYIIDEVHMLTKEAFNALLKTLEEPPSHVIFILATTEVHKLPETIISRTQRYTFKPAGIHETVIHLKTIAKAEKIDIDDEALKLIATHGRGSFRDSISLLDQIGNAGGKITIDKVERSLGIAPEALLDELVSSISHGKPADIIAQLDSLNQQGLQAAQVARQLIQKLRDKILNEKLDINPVTAAELIQKLIEVPASHDPLTRLEIILLEPVLANSTVSIPKPATVAEVPKTKISNELDSLEPDKPVVKSPPKPQKMEKTKEPVTGIEIPVNAKISDLNESAWQQILLTLKQKHNTLYGIARMAVPMFEEDKLTLIFNFPFHQKRFNDSKNTKILVNLIKDQTGKNVTVECIVDKQKASNTSPKPSSLDQDDNKATKPLDTINSIFGGGEIIE
ncbi:DNA polymerase III subunit gamma/tau [Candidatus Saccharibacteria bacterium]|nr:DNA polymerase III subunit gamma/tau [Candidatus Saccharibacteria bacterium]